jgi:hypothetical protein
MIYDRLPSEAEFSPVRSISKGTILRSGCQIE